MRKYHGTPITPRAQLLRMDGMDFCVSFARPDDLKTCLRIGQGLMLDNGAFSAKTRGKAFDRDGFYRWVEPILTHPHWAVVPDVIDGTVEAQREMVKTWPFRRDLGIPVWHLGLPITYLLELCDQWGRVCFGSAGAYWDVGSMAWCGRMDEAFNALVNAYGRQLPWVHGLRMLGQSAGPWPLASADSTNVAQNHSKRTHSRLQVHGRRLPGTTEAHTAAVQVPGLRRRTADASGAPGRNAARRAGSASSVGGPERA